MIEDTQRIEKLCKDALKKVGGNFYKVNTVSDGIKYYERNFAYEYYHQIRLQIKENGIKIDVSGEIPKSARYFHELESSIPSIQIPDIIIHKFDAMSYNQIAFEIKVTKKLTASEIYKDVNKLNKYTASGEERLGYKKGILIVINSNPSTIINKARKNKARIEEIITDSKKKILIWYIDNYKDAQIPSFKPAISVIDKDYFKK